MTITEMSCTRGWHFKILCSKSNRID